MKGGRRVILTGWQGGTAGLRVSADSRRDVFLPLRKTLRCVQVELPGGASRVECRITPAFWRKCPQFRSGEIGRWMEERGDKPWPSWRPPRYNAEFVLLNACKARVRVCTKRR